VTEGRDEAIILRHTGVRYAFLAEKRGRIDVTLFNKMGQPQLSPGVIISYTGHRSNYGSLVAQDVVVEHVPLAWARQDIYLLHYIMEVCYFLIPVGSGEQSIFYLLKDIYRNFPSFTDSIHKKIVVCKFLAHLGICPDTQPFHSYLKILLETPVDNTGIMDLQLICEEDANKWLMWCMHLHPHGKWFKALPFLLTSEQLI